MREPAVYIVANKRNGTLYTNVTSNLPQRAYQRRNGLYAWVHDPIRLQMLVWYDRYQQMEDAIAREKQIKAGPRQNKSTLIEGLNPNWRDLYKELAQ